MRRAYREEGGAAALITVVLLPLIVVVLMGLIELGRVRVIAERARIAADLATITAMNDQDQQALERSGSLRPAGDAARVARDHLALNLEPLAASLASTPQAIAAAADVRVVDRAGSADGRSYSGPTVVINAALPVRTPVFAVLLGRAVTVVALASAATAR